MTFPISKMRIHLVDKYVHLRNTIGYLYNPSDHFIFFSDINHNS